MNCDRLAPWYRWLEYASFGRALEIRRGEFLTRTYDARRVLMLGEGDGRFLAAFLRLNPSARVDYVDASREMLAVARRRASRGAPGGSPPAKARVAFHHVDALDWLRQAEAETYDLVCTHFFLDCFTEVELAIVVREIARAAGRGSRWIVSEFRYPEAGLARWWGRSLIHALYRMFGVLTGLRVRRLPDHAAQMAAAGFRLENRVTAAGGVLVSESWLRADDPLPASPPTPPGAPNRPRPSGFCV